jgi:type IV conjugative transfer system coupling protein TraD
MKTLIRGGQTSLHAFHMSLQLVFTFVKVGILFVIVGNIVYVFSKFGFYDFKELAIFYIAKLYVFSGASEVHMHFTGRYGNIYDLKVSAIVSNVSLIVHKDQIISTVISGFFHGILLALGAIISLCFIFNKRGKKLAKEKFLRGIKIVPAKILRQMISKYNFKDAIKNFRSPLKAQYSISGIQFPRNNEFLHTIVLGSTGTGKTNGILDLLDQIRRNGDAAIIWDKMGTYTSTYYDPARDIILNPLDARSKSWSFFKEIRNESDYDYMASAFIQEKKGNSDQFWIDAARRVFAVFAKKLKEERGSDATNQEFVDALLKVGYEELAQFLIGTEAASLISEKSERTSLSILAILATHITSMKYLHDSADNFSIRSWVESKPNGFLFISSRSDQHESLQPLISTWIDIAVKALLSVEQNKFNSTNPRRIWIILDELGSLHQLPSLLDGLSQSRQFGGAFLIALHAISQLKSVYGKDKTDTITSLCGNKIFFRGADEETAEYCSQNLGYQENEEVKEGISYGANEIRDGVSLNTQRNSRRVVIASEIMNMKALEAYLKFAGHFPISKIFFKIKNRPKLAERFVDIVPVVPNSILEDHEKKLDSVTAEIEAEESPEEFINAKNNSEQLSLFDDEEESISEEELEEENEQETEDFSDDTDELEEEEIEDEESEEEGDGSDESDSGDEENQDSEDDKQSSDKNTTSRKIKFHY